jgi:hypothetical protein
LIVDPNIDYAEYTNSESVKNFLSKIEEWKNANSIFACSFKKEDVKRCLNLSFDEVRSMSSTELNHCAYVVHGYAHHLQLVLGKEKAVLDWINDSIYYIVSDKISNYGDSYTKWEQKFYAAVKENPLAKELFKLKASCLSRVNSLEKTIYPVEKMANMLEQIGRSKI